MGRHTGRAATPAPRSISRRDRAPTDWHVSFVGDTVLDPFWGIGNTTLAAMEMHRSSIGFEIEPKYFEVGKRRIGTPPVRSPVEFITDTEEQLMRIRRHGF